MVLPFDIPIDWVISILQVAITLIIVFLIVRLYRTIVRRLGGTVPAGLVSSLQQIGSWAIWVVGFLVVLNQIHVDVQVLLLIIFLGGSAIIIAYRNILADLAASQFISSYQPFKVGEWIEIQNSYGRVGRNLKVDLVPDAAPQFRVADITPEGARVVLMLRINNPAKRDQVVSEVEKQVYDLLAELDRRLSSRE